METERSFNTAGSSGMNTSHARARQASAVTNPWVLGFAATGFGGAKRKVVRAKDNLPGGRG